MFSTLAFSLLLAAAPPQFRVDLLTTGLTSCNARAINELGEVVVNCGGQLFLWTKDSDENLVPLTPPTLPGPPCISYSVAGFNNARQRLQSKLTLFRCGIGGTSSLEYSFQSGGFSIPVLYYGGLTSSGRFLTSVASIWIAPDEVIPNSSRESFVGLNDSLQSILWHRDRVTWSRYDWRTGAVLPLPGFLSNPVLDQRGWVAGIDPLSHQLIVWDGSATRTLGLPPGAWSPDRLYVLAMKENGWILGNGGLGPWLWDGSNFSVLSSLFPVGTALASVVGITNSGMIAATLGTSESARAVRLVPVTPLEPTDIAAYLPEAGVELDGHGEYIGCGGITGWAHDTKHPNQNIPLEFYADDVLSAAGIAEAKREDGTYSFHIRLPLRLFDGKPHAVNVRFAGSSTQIDHAWGSIACPPPAR